MHQHARSHYSYGTTSSSSIYSSESGPISSSRVSRESHPSSAASSSFQYRSRGESSSSSEHPLPSPYTMTGASPRRPDVPPPNRGSPQAFHLSNLVSSLPPTSPSLGTQLGIPGPQYRPHNPVNPQNFGTRPQRRPGPTSYPQQTSFEQRSPDPSYLPPRSPLQLHQSRSNLRLPQQLPVLQPPIHQNPTMASQPPGRMQPSHSTAGQFQTPQFAGERQEQARGHGRYDPVQEASASSRHRQDLRDPSAQGHRGESRRLSGSHTGEQHRRGNGHSRGGSDSGNGNDNDNGNVNHRRHRRTLKLSDVIH